MKRLYLIGFAVCCLMGSAHAVDYPKGSTFDGRIQHVVYNDNDVVSVNAVVGLGVQIVFAPHENVLDVAGGFSAGWEFKERRNNLYIKPKSVRVGDTDMIPEPGKWDTNVLVTTDVRMYAFDLHLISARDKRATSNTKASYRIQFQYPADEAAKAEKERLKAATQAQLALKDAPVNWNYSMQLGEKSADIAPAMAWDDGRFTYLKFPNNREFPAVFLVAADKTESIVNTHTEASKPGGAKDTLVIHQIAREMVLRSGSAVVGIYNESFDVDGRATDTGATPPGVRRAMKTEQGKANEQ